MKYKLIVFIPLIVCLISCDLVEDQNNTSTSYLPDYNHPEARTLNVPFYPQQTQVWCWAAVIEMVSSYYGNRALQCQTLQYWYGLDCCTFPGSCVTTGTSQQIQQSFFALGINNQYILSSITWMDFVNEIDTGRPIIMFYRNSFAGHVVVAFGYNPEKNTMFIHDPYYGTFEVPYGQSFAYSGSLYWVQTMYGFN